MTSIGRVRAIHIAPERGAPTERVDRVRAFAGCDGDDLTLVESEALEAVERDCDITREHPEPGARSP